MRILKTNFNSKLIRRVVILGFSLAIIAVAIVSKTNRLPGKIAGTVTNPLLVDDKFCDNPASPSQTGCTNFIPPALAAVVNPTYQNISGPVNISGALSQQDNYAYLGLYNSGTPTWPRAGNDLAIAWNFSGGGRDVDLWNTDILNTTGYSFLFKQLTGANSHRDLLSILATGNVGIGLGNNNPIGPLSIGNSSIDGSDGFIVLGKKSGASTRLARIGYDGSYNFVIGDYGNNNTPGTWSSQFGISWQAPANSLYIDSYGSVRASSEIQSNMGPAAAAGGQFRAMYGGYGTIFRQDGANFYILTTNANDPYGKWNNLRPLSINNTNGNVTFGSYVTFGAGHNDLAENYLISGKVLRSSLVSIDDSTSSAATIAGPLRKSLIGIVSTNPGAVMEADGGFHIGYGTKGQYTDEKAPIALAGTVPALVTSQNGFIAIGDPISLSSLPGFGAKATTAGTIVGKALETFNPANASCQAVSSLDAIEWPEDNGKNSNKPCFKLPDGTYVGKIMVAVNLSWYDPDIYLTSTNNFHLDLDQLKDTGNNLITRIGAFGKLIAGKIQAGIIETQKLIVNGVDILDKLNRQEQEISELKTTVQELQQQLQSR